MTLFELLSVGVFLVLVAIGLMFLVVILKGTPHTSSAELVGRGDFSRALAEAEVGPEAERDALLAAVVAAKHMLELETAEDLAGRIVASDETDGEAWMERGLIAAYRGDHASAEEYLANAERSRSDLFESISLHRAWSELRSGDAERARRRFEEIAAPLESKLRTDLGPGDPLFAEWFFQAADLWDACGASDKSEWARREARRSAPDSPLIDRYA